MGRIQVDTKQKVHAVSFDVQRWNGALGICLKRWNRLPGLLCKKI